MILTLSCDEDDVDDALLEVRESYANGNISGRTTCGGTWEIVDDAANDPSALGRIFTR